MMMEHAFPPEASGGRLAQWLRMVDAFERDEIEAAVDGLIALLDAHDGDPDLEPDFEGEDSDEDAPNEDGSDEVFATLPIYGLDQSAGPINSDAATREHYAAQLGLTRTLAGGWRRRA